MNRFREIPPWCVSLTGAGTYLFWMVVLAKAGGPNWVMVPNDLVYTYLFNGLNLLTGHLPGTLIHPATTVSLFFALCTWVIHKVVGSGELVRDVIQNAEFYMRSVNSIIVGLNTAAMFALGQMIYVGTRRRLLIPVVQGSFILCPTMYLSFNSFGSPESFQTLFLVLLAGVTISTLQQGLPDQRSRRAYIIVAALFTGATIGTKFTSIPVVLLPLLIIPRLRWKAAFLGLAAICTTLFIFPVFLSWHQFLSDMNLLTNMATRERGAIGSASFLGALLTQARELFSTMRLFCLILCLEIICWLVIAFFGPKRRAQFANAYSMYRAFVLTAMVTSCLILIRPKEQYFGPYTVVLGMGLALLIYMAARFFSAPAETKHPLRHIPNLAAGAIVVVYVAVAFFEFNRSATGVPLLAQMRDDAFKINRMVFPIPDDHALVTAIQASNLYTAFDHANEYSHFVFTGTTALLTPSNRYNYLLDGVSVLDRYWLPYSLHDLKIAYKKLYYWSILANFRRNEWRLPPDAVLRNVFAGSAEALAEVEAVAVGNPYNPANSVDENAAFGWSVVPCVSGCRSIQISFGDLRDEVITDYELQIDDSQVAQSMPLRWRVEASVNGHNWETLAVVREDKPWSADETRTYKVQNARPYHLYRFIEIDGHSGLTRKWPSRVKLYSAGSSIRSLFPVAASFVPRKSLGFLDIIADGKRKKRSGFPGELTAASDRPLRVWQYILETGEHEIDVIKSGPMPKSWILYGSLDGQQWQEIDRREHSNEWERKGVYSMAHPGFYRYFHMRFDGSFHPSILRTYKLTLVGAWDDSDQSLERITTLRQPFWEKTGPFPIGVQLDFSTATKALGYSLRAGPDGSNSTRRMPTEWELFGSNDGRSWTSIDIQTGQSGWKNMEERTFQISDRSEYAHYRFVFGAANSSALRIHDIQLLGAQACPRALADCSGEASLLKR